MLFQIKIQVLNLYFLITTLLATSKNTTVILKPFLRCKMSPAPVEFFPSFNFEILKVVLLKYCLKNKKKQID